MLHAPSGTGKTACLVLGCISRLNLELAKCQAIFVTPTRELAIAISHLTKSLGPVKPLCILQSRTSSTSSILSKKAGRDFVEESGCHLIFGNPGNIENLIGSGGLDTREVKMLIFEELDELLSRGYEKEILNIISVFSNSAIQLCVGFASNPSTTSVLAKMQDPVFCIVQNPYPSLEGMMDLVARLTNALLQVFSSSMYSVKERNGKQKL